MQGRGQFNMKGKLVRDLDCKCCTLFNFKKLDLYNDKLTHKKEANEYMMDNGSHLYPPLVSLFKNEILEISVDHPVGEDVIFLNGKFYGYVSDWMEMLSLADAYGIEYKNYKELKERVEDNLYG